MNNYCKNDHYKIMFNKIYSKFIMDKDKISDRISNCVDTVDNNLNKILQTLYAYEIKESFDHIEKKEQLIIKPKEQNLKTNHQINLQFLKNQSESLNNIHQEICKILKDNYKVNDSYNELYRNNSEVVLVDKEELVNNNKLSPVVNINKFSEHESENIISEINTNFNKINSLLKKLNDISKPADHSINLDLSNTSLINSIYLSNLITNEKNNTERDNKTTFLEIERFVMQYEDKLYFYDALFDYMNNFIKSKKVKFSLIREKPQVLGNLIENILRDWLKSKKYLDNYKNKIKQIITK